MGPTSRVQARPRWRTHGGGEGAIERAEGRSVGVWRRFIEAPAFLMRGAGRRRVRTKSVQGFEDGDSLSRPSSFALCVGSWRAV